MTRSPPTPLSQVIESISNAPVLDTELEYTCVPRSRARSSVAPVPSPSASSRLVTDCPVSPLFVPAGSWAARSYNVYSSGSVFMSRPMLTKIPCLMNLHHFPFDVQDCYFSVGSWAYDGYELDIKPYPSADGAKYARRAARREPPSGDTAADSPRVSRLSPCPSKVRRDDARPVRGQHRVCAAQGDEQRLRHLLLVLPRAVPAHPLRPAVRALPADVLLGHRAAARARHDLRHAPSSFYAAGGRG